MNHQEFIATLVNRPIASVDDLIQRISEIEPEGISLGSLNAEFFESLESDARKIKASVALQYFSQIVRFDAFNNEPSGVAEEILPVAELIFNEFPDEPIDTDIECTLSGIPSPWSVECYTAMEYVCAQIAFSLEDDEGIITDALDTQIAIADFMSDLPECIDREVMQSAIEQRMEDAE